MHCEKCGAENIDGADVCKSCGQPFDGAVASDSPESHSNSAAKPSAARVVYAGFWLRLAAFVVDMLIVGIFVGIVIVGPLLKDIAPGGTTGELWAFYSSGTRQAIALILLTRMAQWLYFASFESSVWQATVGKRALGLFVTDLAGKRITFARASGRFFGKMLSEFIFFAGFVMAGFTEKKQALHDQLAGCLVLRKF